MSVTVNIDTTAPSASVTGNDALYHTGGVANAWTLNFAATDPNLPDASDGITSSGGSITGRAGRLS